MRLCISFIGLLCISLSAHCQEFEPIHHAFDVVNYELHTDIKDCFSPPYPSLFYASEIITIEVDSTLNHIKLDASNAKLIIDSISAPFTLYSHSGNIADILLDHAYSPGDTIFLHIYYHHKNVVDESFYAYGGYVYTDCEPEGARNWFPCYDKPADKATVELFATVPANAKLGSNGSLIDSTLDGDALTYHWKSRDPLCTYLITMVGKINFELNTTYWNLPSHPEDSIPLNYYYAAGENIGDVEINLPDMMNYFSTLYGDYAFEKYGNASSVDFYSEGMENQSMTIICKNCWSNWLVSHELAHQWFGDLISPKSWADIFLNEAFAQYNELLYQTKDADESVLEDSIKDYANYYLAHNPGFAISMNSWATHTPPFDTLFNDIITYTKAPCVIHTLRNILGDDMFFNTLKAYTQHPDFRFKNASIQDFNQFVNSYTGIDLNYFFDEWIFQPNHPVYENTYSITGDAASWQIDFTIQQTQPLPSLFTMPVELLVNFMDGTDSTIKVMNDITSQTYIFNFTKQPKNVKFDPLNKIPLKEFSIAGGILENMPEASMNVYPNPASDNITITYSIENACYVKLTVLDVTSTIIKSNTIGFKPAGNYSETMSVSTLPKGIYFIKLNAEKYTWIKKIVIQ